MNLILKLWDEAKLLIRDGIYFADGRSFFVDVKHNGDMQIESIVSFDIESFFAADPEWVTSIDITKQAQLTDGSYFCCGEGSYGSEGFFAYLDDNKKLLWVIYFENLNPFNSFTIQQDKVIVESTSGVKLKLNLIDPRTIEFTK